MGYGAMFEDPKMWKRVKNSVHRKNEMTLMKSARKSLGKPMAEQSKREIVRMAIKTLLNCDFPFAVVETFIEFLPLQHWDEDVDVLGKPLLISLFFENGDVICDNSPLVLCQNWDINSEPAWKSANGSQIDLSRNEVQFFYKHRKIAYVCDDGFQFNGVSEFRSKYITPTSWRNFVEPTLSVRITVAT